MLRLRGQKGHQLPTAVPGLGGGQASTPVSLPAPMLGRWEHLCWGHLCWEHHLLCAGSGCLRFGSSCVGIICHVQEVDTFMLGAPVLGAPVLGRKWEYLCQEHLCWEHLHWAGMVSGS